MTTGIGCRNASTRGPTGYVSSQWKLAFEAQQGRRITGEIRQFNEEADADFIPARMIATCEAAETMQPDK